MMVSMLPHLAESSAARAYLESIRWANGVVCPRCGAEDAAARLRRRADSSARQGLWSCKACRKQFTVATLTLFQDTRLPLSTWLRAIDLLCRAREGITAQELARQLPVSYKSAWKLIDRIRYALNRRRLGPPPVGEPQPLSLYPWTLDRAAGRFLKIVPPRLHPDRLERAEQKRLDRL